MRHRVDWRCRPSCPRGRYTKPDFETAWATCERVDWLLDLAGAFDLDEPSQRALVAGAAASLTRKEPTLLRLRPPGYRIAEAWAMGGDAESLDMMNTRRFDDYKNAVLLYLPIAVAAILFIHYRTDWPRWTNQLIAFTCIPVIHVCAVAWGWGRVRLTRRASGSIVSSSPNATSSDRHARARAGPLPAWNPAWFASSPTTSARAGIASPISPRHAAPISDVPPPRTSRP